MTPINKFKSEVGEDLYRQRVTAFAAEKNIAGAIKICDNCGQLQLCHNPGPCKRSDKSESKFSDEQMSQLIHAVNEDIVREIIKSDSPSTNDKLATALEKISEVLEKRSPVSSQVVTKVKLPPSWAKESFADYKDEVEAWESAHPGDNFQKYSEFINELKKNKSKAGLSDYVSEIVIEKTRVNKTVSSKFRSR